MTTSARPQRPDQDQPARAGLGFPPHRHHQRAVGAANPDGGDRVVRATPDQQRNAPGGNATTAAGGAAGRRRPGSPLRAPARRQGGRRHLRRPGIPGRARSQHARRAGRPEPPLSTIFAGCCRRWPTQSTTWIWRAGSSPTWPSTAVCALSPATRPCCTPGRDSKAPSGCRSCSPEPSARSGTWMCHGTTRSSTRSPQATPTERSRPSTIT